MTVHAPSYWRHVVLALWLSLLGLCLGRAAAQQQPFFRIFGPTDLDRRLNRGVVVISLYGRPDIQAVRARIETVEVDLFGSMAEPSISQWDGVLGIASLPEGVHQVSAIVTYSDGSQVTASLGSVNYDRAPQVTITQPIAGATATPLLALEATCTDGPDACRTLVATYRQSASIDRTAPLDPQRLIACDPAGISGTFDLSRFAGTSGWLDFYSSDRGTDETDREGVISIPITVAGSPSACEDQVDAGGCATAAPAAPTVSAPSGAPVAQPELELGVACTSAPGTPCTGTYVWYQRNPSNCCLLPPEAPRYRDLLACGATAHAKTLDLSGFDGTDGWLVFAAHNERGSTRAASLPLAVDAAAALCDVDRVNGPILDADAHRVFLLTPDLSVARLFDRGTQQYQTLMTSPPIPRGALSPFPSFRWAKVTPRGAVFAVDASGVMALWEVDGSSLSQLSANATSFLAAGHFVAWIDRELSAIMRRDLNTDSTVSVGPTGGFDLGSNGDVVFVSSDEQIWRFRTGVPTQLTTDTSYRYSHPLTDGTYVLYKRSDRALVLFGPDGEQIIDSQGGEYEQLNAGHVVFQRNGSLFIRTQGGVTRELEMTATVESINSAGEVMVVAGTSVEPWRRYLIRSGADPLDVSSSVGTPLPAGSGWYIAMNGALLSPRLGDDCARDGGVPEPDGGVVEPDGGVPEPDGGGAADGGVEEPMDADTPLEEDAQTSDAETEVPDGSSEEPLADAADEETGPDAAERDAGRSRRHPSSHCALSGPGTARNSPLSAGACIMLAAWALGRRASSRTRGRPRTRVSCKRCQAA